MTRLRGRSSFGDDSGFGLIEAIVALVIAGVVFGALATSLIAAVQASLFSRQNQQATDFMTREIEELRLLDFGAVAHPGAVSDSRTQPCPAGQCLEVDGVLEPLHIVPGGKVTTISRNVSGAQANNTTFTISRYVTAMSDQPVANAVRVTVYATWENRGVTRSRSMSTIIAFTQRGLPLPVFRFELPAATASVNPGGTLVFEFTVANQGAPDRFNLAHNGGGSWRWYADTDADGEFDPAIDQLLTDSNVPADGVPDSGRLDPATTRTYFLVRETLTSTPTGTQTLTVTARSTGQPMAPGGTKTVTATAVITAGVVVPPPPPPPTGYVPEPACAAVSTPAMPTSGGGYSVIRYTLHNNGQGPSTLHPQLLMSTGAGDEGALGNYSTDVDVTGKGRVLEGLTDPAATPAQVLSSTNPRQYADWVYQFPRKGSVEGVSVLRFWVAPFGPPGGSSTFKAVLYTTSGTGAKTPVSAADFAVATTCAGWQEVYVSLPAAPATPVAKSAFVGVRLVTTSAPTVRLAYDVPAQFDASLTMRVK